MKGKASVFDVDGTLSKGFLIVKFPVALNQEGEFDSAEIDYIQKLVEEYRSGNCDYKEAATNIVYSYGRGIKGKRRSEIERIGSRYVELNPDEKFDFSENLINMMKSKGYLTLAVSGSPCEVVLPLSKSLGIDITYATSFKTDNDKFTGEVEQNCAVHETKIDIVRSLFRERCIDPRLSAGFGDTDQDISFLDLVGYPVAVNPNQKLEQHAQKKTG